METERQKKIKSLEAELGKLKSEENHLNKLGYEYRLATFLHEKLCTWNHTDGCGWFYDRGDWSESSRQDYLQKAKKLISMGLTEEQITQVIGIMKGI